MQIRIDVFCTMRSAIGSTAARVLLTSPSSQIVGNGISRAPQLALSAARVLLTFRSDALLQSRQCVRPTFTAHQLKMFKHICSAIHSNLRSSWQPVFCSLDPQAARVSEASVPKQLRLVYPAACVLRSSSPTDDLHRNNRQQLVFCSSHASIDTLHRRAETATETIRSSSCSAPVIQ
jgi:hypothetical protein